MSLLLLVYCILTQTLAIVESAPKLEQKVHDSIKADEIEIDDSSSDGYLSVDLVIPNLRSDDKSEEGTGFAGYIFDERICKLLGGRILCGYNRNKGDYDKNIPIDLGNGCFIRNDRIECGYKLPFDSNSANLRSKPTKRTVFETETSQQVTTDKSISTTKIEMRTNNKEQSNLTALPIDLPVSTISKSTTSEIKTSNHKELEESVTATQQLIEQSNTSRKTNTSSLSSTLVASVRSNNMLTSPALTEYNTTQSSTASPITSEANLIVDKVKLTHSTLSDLANDVLLENDNKTVNTNEGLDTKNLESTNEKMVTETQTKTSCVQNDDRVVCYHYKTN